MWSLEVLKVLKVWRGKVIVIVGDRVRGDNVKWSISDEMQDLHKK